MLFSSWHDLSFLEQQTGLESYSPDEPCGCQMGVDVGGCFIPRGVPSRSVLIGGNYLLVTPNLYK